MKAYCTDKNLLVKEYVDTQTESGIELGDNSDPYSLYEILEVNPETLDYISEVVGKKLDEKELKEKYLLLYSGFSRVPLTRTKFIVHIKDCLMVVEKQSASELTKD